MNKKIFLLLFAALILLFFVGFYSKDGKVELSNVPIPNLNTADINVIKINNSKSNIELNLVDNKWLVSSAWGYKANVSKINTLLLKLLSPQSIQHIPYSDSGAKKLGLDKLSDTNFDVELLNGDKSLSKLRLGLIRKNSSASNPTQVSAQYAKLEGAKKVMLLKSAINASVDNKSWIATDLINILASDVLSVSSYNGDKLLFSVTRPSKEEKKLNLDIPKDKKVIKTLVNQSFSSLENLSIEEVKPLDQAKEISFERSSKFFLNNGLVYTVFTNDKFLKIQVGFDQDSFMQAKKLYTNHNAKQAANEKEEATKKEDKVEEAKLESSNLAAAKSLNDNLGKWLFTLPSYSHSKFRKEKKDFFE